MENILSISPKKCLFYLFPPCFLLLWVFFLIAEGSSQERLGVSPSCGKSGGSYGITLWLSHAKSAASLSTQTYIPPLPATAAVAEAVSQWAEATAPCHRGTALHPPVKKGRARCFGSFRPLLQSQFQFLIPTTPFFLLFFHLLFICRYL